MEQDLAAAPEGGMLNLASLDKMETVEYRRKLSSHTVSLRLVAPRLGAGNLQVLSMS